MTGSPWDLVLNPEPDEPSLCWQCFGPLDDVAYEDCEACRDAERERKDDLDYERRHLSL